MANGSVHGHKVEECFEKAWRSVVRAEYRYDTISMNKLKMLFIYARCTYRFRAGCLSLKRNYDG